MKFDFCLKRLKQIALLLLMLGCLASCKTNKNITYFKDIPDTLSAQYLNVSASSFVEPKIQSNDLLQVSILTLDPVVNSTLNNESVSSFSTQPGSSSITPASPQAVTGFLVGKDGTIELPIIGKIKLAGLTTAEARDSIRSRVAVYYKDAVVNVRFINFAVTVLGEVARPSTYIVPNEKVSILDAIGMAGDLTIFGKRENVLLIRDTMGHKQFVRFNLNSSSILNSPYFYLHQGDMIYVEPNKSKIASTDAVQARNYTLIAAIITVVVTLASRL